tara:strand:- start:408 stop:1094 length:687 start_codon:yes stop_codon:yes gene_type:complete
MGIAFVAFLLALVCGLTTALLKTRKVLSVAHRTVSFYMEALGEERAESKKLSKLLGQALTEGRDKTMDINSTALYLVALARATGREDITVWANRYYGLDDVGYDGWVGYPQGAPEVCTATTLAPTTNGEARVNEDYLSLHMVIEGLACTVQDVRENTIHPTPRTILYEAGDALKAWGVDIGTLDHLEPEAQVLKNLQKVKGPEWETAFDALVQRVWEAMRANAPDHVR